MNAMKSDNKDKTVYISSPLSFLNLLFCGCKSQRIRPGDGKKRRPGRPWLSFFKTILAEFWGNSGDAYKHRRWLLISLTLLVMTATGWITVFKSSEHKAMNLMEQGKCRECLAYVENVLRENPRNKNLCKIETEAIVKDILHHGWAQQLKHGHFSEARKFLEDMTKQNSDLPERLKTVRLLNWIAEIEEYFFERSPGTPIVIFQDEIRTESLLTQWDREKNDIRCLLNQIGKENTELPPDRIYRCLERLQAQKRLYSGVIQDFKTTIDKMLDTDRPSALMLTINEFKRKFPAIGGLEALNEDLANYMRLREKINSEQWPEDPGVPDNLCFQTEPFVARVDTLLSTRKELRHARSTFRNNKNHTISLAKLRLSSESSKENN
ncbi:hypothetical protein [Desulfonema magnum]|uniref:Uncharacterized protein n=1 Tax=Desulfonema magnum TaxID=45655 RepID=A0A975BQS9_9BACT|nr:hypothetical protein [Desulfonema magnum]QTA89931.1 Uncharacterized protein dnm_059900 [Desulfonema magnum]